MFPQTTLERGYIEVFSMLVGELVGCWPLICLSAYILLQI